MLQVTVTVLALLASSRVGRAATHPDDVAALQALTASLDDKDAFLASPGILGGWKDSDPCTGGQIPGGWVGVTCDSSEPARVTSLNLAQLGPGVFKATLPADLQKLGAATVLHLEGAGFHGTLPAAWSGFEALQELYLGDNDISGSLPSEWGSKTRFQSLTTLTLYSNKLTGGLPDSWGSSGAFPKLRTLTLSNNDISGSLPSSWASGFPAMYDMNLDSLHLSGSLPSTFKSDSLHSLHVQHNNLTGQLPSSYPLELPHLEDLQVQGNQLQGSVPATWQNWGSLKTVSLLLGNSLCGRLDASFVETKDGQRVQDAQAAGGGSLELAPCSGVTHRSMLASAAAAWWVWALAILLACLAVVGLAKRRTVYVLLKGDQGEDGQKHLVARGGGKGRGGNKGASKAAELV